MSLIAEQIEAVKEVFQKHEKYHHFSGLACVIVGIFWLAANYYLVPYIMVRYEDSQIALLLLLISVAFLSVLIGAVLTIRERQKRGKMIATLSLKRIVYKLVLISISTLVLTWFFYATASVFFIPFLFMLMYGLLILTSKDNLPTPIQTFGYLNFASGLVGLLPVWNTLAHANYLAILSLIVLGLGHIVLGIILMVHDK